MRDSKLYKFNGNNPDTNNGEPIAQKSKTLCWKEWNNWVEKNGKPKYTHQKPDEEIKNIRFRKSGPITKSDWDNFLYRNAQLKSIQFELKERNSLLKFSPKTRKSYLYLNKMNPYPIKINNTPIPEFKSIFTLSGMMKYCCLDRDKEAEFWRYLRFPVSKKALNYNISKRILNLAKPKLNL